MAVDKDKARTDASMWIWGVPGLLGVIAIAAIMMGRNKVAFGTMGMLLGAVVTALAIGFFLTVRIGRKQTEEDNEVAPAVKRSPFLLNPVVLAFVAFALIVLALIIYFGFMW